MDAKKLLIVDDEESIVKQLQWAFKDEFEVITATDSKSAVESVKQYKPGLMLLDLCLTEEPWNLEGFNVLSEVMKENPMTKVIVVTGHDEKENALKAVEHGAYDFYTKPISIDEMRIILRRAANFLTLEEELAEIKERESVGTEFEGIVAMSKPMLDIFETVKKIAPTDVAVLITGESGTGKELVARAIHERSQRKDKPFVPINCGAIPENLLESELFGHEKGSFTGADTSREGRFETAEGGTIFLDEIGELSPALQVKILRFLQDHIIERVGGRLPISVDVRIIAATNRNLEEMINEKAFREDLYYRINTINIKLPPLRERGDDILLLAMRFLHRYNREFARKIKGFSDAAVRVINSYNWPGNVRELENRIKRGVLMAAGNTIEPRDLDLSDEGAQKENTGSGTSGQTFAREEPKTLKEAKDAVELKMIVKALIQTRGNISASAKLLDISRPTLHDLLKKHNVDPEDYRVTKK